MALYAAQKTYSYAEIDTFIARGDVNGKLTRDDLPTPALILDLDAFESNVKKMIAYVHGKGRAIRPHGKTHKCPHIAKYLIGQGAVGACAAKLSEAVAFAENGVTGILVTTSVIGKYKIERAVALAKQHPDLILCTDSVQNAQDLNEAAAAANVKLNVAIDLCVGNRTGILPGEAAVALGEWVAQQSNLRLQGVQAYAGPASHTVGWENRKNASIAAMTPAADVRRALEKKGIECPWLSGGSTGTYNIDTDIDGTTEMQPGSFMFMDVDYNRIGSQSGTEKYSDFQNALFVLTTVVSKPKNEMAIVDGGLKAFSTDKPWMPEWRGGADLPYGFAGDEHGRLMLKDKQVKVGDRLEWIIPHCDPSVNLYDRIYAVRGENVEAVWRIAARGMSQ